MKTSVLRTNDESKRKSCWNKNCTVLIKGLDKTVTAPVEDVKIRKFDYITKEPPATT